MTTMYLLSLALPCSVSLLAGIGIGRWSGERAARRSRR